jgi:hypothetical protein
VANKQMMRSQQEQLNGSMIFLVDNDGTQYDYDYINDDDALYVDEQRHDPSSTDNIDSPIGINTPPIRSGTNPGIGVPRNNSYYGENYTENNDNDDDYDYDDDDDDDDDSPPNATTTNPTNATTTNPTSAANTTNTTNRRHKRRRRYRYSGLHTSDVQNSNDESDASDDALQDQLSWTRSEIARLSAELHDSEAAKRGLQTTHDDDMRQLRGRFERKVSDMRVEANHMRHQLHALHDLVDDMELAKANLEINNEELFMKLHEANLTIAELRGANTHHHHHHHHSAAHNYNNNTNNNNSSNNSSNNVSNNSNTNVVEDGEHVEHRMATLPSVVMLRGGSTATNTPPPPTPSIPSTTSTTTPPTTNANHATAPMSSTSMDAAATCICCCEARIDTVFQCKHAVACEGCARRILATANETGCIPRCPFCREPLLMSDTFRSPVSTSSQSSRETALIPFTRPSNNDPIVTSSSFEDTTISAITSSSPFLTHYHNPHHQHQQIAYVKIYIAGSSW